MPGWWWVVAASAQTAGETEAESSHDRFVSMRDVAPIAALVRPVEAPIVLDQGPERLTLTGGWLVPVFSGRQAGAWERDVDAWLAQADPDQVPRVPAPEERGTQELVGFVWTGGTGALSLALPDRADALILANRAVRELGGDHARYAGLAHDRALQVPVTEAIVLGVDPALDAWFAGPDHVDPYEIVVLGASDEARKRARQAVSAFERRTKVWDELDRDVADRIAWERLAEQRGLLPEDGRYVHWDLLTGDRYGLVAPAIGGEADQWLAVTTDPTGATDPRREIRVAALGLAPDGRDVDGLVGGVPFPPSVPEDPTSAPQARRRVEPVDADATVLVAPDPTNLTLKVTVDSALRMQAVGGPVGWIDLELPRQDAVPGTFRVVKAELADGTALLGRDAELVALAPPDDGDDRPPPPPPEPRPRDRRDPRPDPTPQPLPEPEPDELDERGGRVRLHLPTPLGAGDVVDVHLVYEDTWALAHGTEVANVGAVSLGVTSGLQWFLPTVEPLPLGAPWPFRARLAVPEGSGLDVVLSGKTRREWAEGGWSLVEADSEGHPGYWATAVVGRYEDRESPEQLGLPAVRVHLSSTHYGTIDQFAPEVRRVVKFYEGWLPPFPFREVEVFESPRGLGGMRWVAAHGTVDVQQMLTGGAVTGGARNQKPHLEHGILAHEIAHQYFGHLAPPASIEDFWISESFSELFACVYLSGAFDRRHCQVRMDAKRARWEGADAPPVEASLTRAYLLGARGPTVYDYGPYLLGEVLSRRIGVEGFFGAVDLMLRDHPYEPLSTERLQAYLEAAAGRELDDTFAFWVHGGYVPALTLTWRQQPDGRVVGAVTADVPFGTFDVPVRVSTKEGAVDAMVTVVDGEGALEVAAPAGGGLKVALDPDGWVVAAARRVRRER